MISLSQICFSQRLLDTRVSMKQTLRLSYTNKSVCAKSFACCLSLSSSHIEISLLSSCRYLSIFQSLSFGVHLTLSAPVESLNFTNPKPRGWPVCLLRIKATSVSSPNFPKCSRKPAWCKERWQKKRRGMRPQNK
jgi:hypothetical protein